MRIGIVGGLWDVLKCDEKVKFVCKYWVEGVIYLLKFMMIFEFKCLEDWGVSSRMSLCFKLYVKGKYEKKMWFEF